MKTVASVCFFLITLFPEGFTRFNTDLTRCCKHWHDNITQLLQISLLHIQDGNLFHHIVKLLYWTETADCRGHLSAVNLSLCARNHFEIMWALWRGLLSCFFHTKCLNFLFLSDRSGVVFCRCRDALLHTWLFALLLLLSAQSFSHSPLPSGINKAFPPREIPLTEYFLSLGPFLINPTDGGLGKFKSIISFWNSQSSPSATFKVT